MTRPMPGPPECECREVPAHLWTTYAGAVDPTTLFEYTPECPLHGEVSSPKRLTDAECAAEFWRAMNETNSAALNHCPDCLGCQAIVNEELTWHRFATRPHALEES